MKSTYVPYRLSYVDQMDEKTRESIIKNSNFDTSLKSLYQTYSPEYDIEFDPRTRKALIVKIDRRFLKNRFFLWYFIKLPFLGFSLFKIFQSFYLIKPISFLIYSVSFWCLARFIKVAKDNEKYTIREIWLDRNGRQLEIRMMDNSVLNIAVNEIRKVNRTESFIYWKLNESSNMYPIIIHDMFYYLSNQSDIVYGEIFDAITDGKRIKVER